MVLSAYWRAIFLSLMLDTNLGSLESLQNHVDSPLAFIATLQLWSPHPPPLLGGDAGGGLGPFGLGELGGVTGGTGGALGLDGLGGLDDGGRGAEGPLG